MVAEETTRPQSPAFFEGRIRSYGKRDRFATDRVPYSPHFFGNSQRDRRPATAFAKQSMCCSATASMPNRFAVRSQRV